MAENVTEFKHQAVRDLAWAVSSPPLISQPSHLCLWPQAGWFQQIGEESSALLARIDADCAELDALIATRKDQRLGKYFEVLWYYWLSHSPRYQIVENNIQIVIDGEALGEIDFILFDTISRQTIHWEVAVKFYLGVGDTAQMSNWYGPNLRDRLDIKVKHLLHRQSLISKNQRVSDWLHVQGIHIDRCAVILKGRLYYPWDYFPQFDLMGHLPSAWTPASCEPEHSFSWWMTETQFEKAFDEDQRFIALLNKGWMEKIPTTYDGELFSKNAIIETVSNNLMRFPLQVQWLNPCGIRDRVFLVSDNWTCKIA